MRSRRRRARAVAWLLVTILAPVPSVDAQSIDGLPDSRFIERRERMTAEGGGPLDVRFLITSEAAAQTERVVTATRAAIAMLSGWFGPPPSPSLTVAGVPWRGDATTTPTAGVITAPLRWLSPARDRATERALINGLVRHYWRRAESSSAFEEALMVYTGTRAIHHQLELTNFATLRFFGGIVPLSLRSVLLSPPIEDPRPRAFQFDEPQSPGDQDVVRGLRALQTLERYVGWPTMLQALSTLRASAPSTYDVAALADALSDARGTDMRFLVAECFRRDAVFDYALADLQSRAAADGLVETTLTIARHGSGIFATQAGASGGDPSMPVRTRFADGSEVREFVDGATPASSLVYTGRAGAVSATVDPDLMLLLDVNRANNTIMRDATSAPLGIRLALTWMTWLQNTVLSYSAVL